MRIQIVILDANDRQVDELVVEMAPTTTAQGVVEGVRRYAPDLLPESGGSYSVTIIPPSNTPLSSNLLEEGGQVIIKPELPDFRIVRRRGEE